MTVGKSAVSLSLCRAQALPTRRTVLAVNGELLRDLGEVRSSDESDDSLLAESLQSGQDLGASGETGWGEGAVDV